MSSRITCVRGSTREWEKEPRVEFGRRPTTTLTHEYYHYISGIRTPLLLILWRSINAHAEFAFSRSAVNAVGSRHRSASHAYIIPLFIIIITVTQRTTTLFVILFYYIAPPRGFLFIIVRARERFDLLASGISGTHTHTAWPTGAKHRWNRPRLNRTINNKTRNFVTWKRKQIHTTISRRFGGKEIPNRRYRCGEPIDMRPIYRVYVMCPASGKRATGHARRRRMARDVLCYLPLDFYKLYTLFYGFYRSL